MTPSANNRLICRKAAPNVSMAMVCSVPLPLTVHYE